MVATVNPIEKACPREETLADFNLGKLPLTELEAIADHLSWCRHCESVLGRLNKEGDSVFVRVKRCLESPRLQYEDAWAARGSSAREIAAAPTEADTTDPFRNRKTNDEPAIGQSVGPYTVLTKLGQGGMGVVYQAYQEAIGRQVALKMVLAGVFSGRDAIARFRTEGTAVARLQHANVVQLYEFGAHNGLPYFSMELMPGGSLSAKLAAGPLDIREAAELVRTLALAVEYAHARNVVHRDLKPGNILLTEDGTPKIADFGLAKLLDAETQAHTLSEAALGTPSYMAPEQTGGRASEIGPATDVYGLGAILYAALTGCPPFQAAKREQIIAQVQRDEPVPPSRRRAGVPAALDYICLKCLEKAPSRRYPSAQALADDLGRWLGNQRPQGMPGVVRRTFRRLRRRAAVVLCGLLLVFATGAVYVGFHTQTPPTRDPLAEIQDELTQGKRVTLIDQVGEPKWSHVLTGGPEVKTYQDTDGSFVVDSWPYCLVELMPDPLHDSYRFTAQLRHRQCDVVAGEVGLYVARQEHPRQRGNVHFITQVGFNDIRQITFADLLTDPGAEALRKLPPRKPKKPAVQLVPRLISDTRWPQHIYRSVGGKAGPRYTMAGEGNTKWHEVEVTVTPQQVSVRWDGSKPFAMLTKDIQNRMQESVFDLRPHHQDDPDVQRMLPTFHVRGGLGLYVTRGSASFRAVTLAPDVQVGQ